MEWRTEYPAQLLNACLRLSYFLRKCRTATVILILKPAKDSCRLESSASYRTVCERKGVLIAETFVFPDRYSFTHQLMGLNDFIMAARTNRQPWYSLV